jgi:hypothetical protein
LDNNQEKVQNDSHGDDNDGIEMAERKKSGFEESSDLVEVLSIVME